MTVSSNSTLTKPSVYESRQIQLTSPLLHIGSAIARLNPFEYVQTSKRVYLPDQEAFARALQERGFLRDYIQCIEDRGEIISLLENAFGENWQTTTGSKGEVLFPSDAISKKWTSEQITDFRPMIRNGMRQLYIPGSSIKGAMRTAIAYHLLKHADQYNVPSPQQISEIERKLRQSMGELKQQAKFFDDRLLMDALFSDFDLVYGDRSIPARKGPNTDFMRAVHVSDSAPLIKEEVVNKKGQKALLNLAIAAEVIISSRFPDYRAKYRASVYAEMVRLAKSQFTITLDREMLSWFRHSQGMQIPFKTIEDILKLCQEFAQDQWDFEHDYWQDLKDNPRAQGKNLSFNEIRSFYEAVECPYQLRIGWASGMPGTTVNLLIDDDLRAEIRDTCGLKAPGFEAPKSRRTVVGSSGEIRYVPGWIKFRIV
jgi:CRISPR-associated protein Csm5